MACNEGIGSMKKHYTPISEIPFSVALSQPAEISGKPVEVSMIPVEKLVVDRRYQRVIRADGRKNIRHIIEMFDWMHFQPILVSPVKDGKYAIVDGQHRAIAAFHHGGVPEVPAAIVDISPEDQAHVFAEINSNVIKVNPLEVFWARYHSGRCELSKQIYDLCQSADLEIMRYIPNGSQAERNFENFERKIWAIPAIKGSLARHDYEHVLMALTFLTEWDIHPYAPNAMFLIVGVCNYLKINKMTNYPDDYPEALADRCCYSDVKDATESEPKRKPLDVFYHDFLKPTLDEVQERKQIAAA